MSIPVQAQPVRALPYVYTLLLVTEADQQKELLNRESRAAHNSLIEPTPKCTLPAIGTYSSSQQQSPISPTSSRLKSKRSKTSIEKPKTKKSIKTYGRSSQDIFEFYGGSDGELGITPRRDLGHKAGKCKKNENAEVDQATSRRGSQEGDVTRGSITSSMGNAELLSTEANGNETSSAYEEEVALKSAMPPPASKFTSSDQSQRSHIYTMPAITDSTLLKSAMSDIVSPTGATYSETQSDERLSAPTRPSRGEIEEEHLCGMDRSVGSQFMPSNEAMESFDLQSTNEQAPSSSSSEISPSKTIIVRRMKQAVKVSEGVLPIDSNVSTAVNPVVLLPAPTDTVGAQDELALSLPESASRGPAKPAKLPKRNRDTDDEPFDELGYDENAVGMPKENYQPRPSKRRSGAGDGEIFVPTDFSKRPEALAKGKRKTKRHKTTAFQELLPKDEDEDEEVQILPDPRFEIPEKKSPKISTDMARPDVEKNDDTEEIQPETQPEPNQAAKSTGQKKRGRPKKVATNLSEETVADDTEADQAHLDAETEEISGMAKKSRKKTKNKETSLPIIDEQDGNDDHDQAAECDPKDLPAHILNDTHGNISPLKPTAKPLPETSPAQTNPTPETPRKSATPAPKGPDKHSPISSGKVAYRVGLSKRARIAPLLRIVRK